MNDNHSTPHGPLNGTAAISILIVEDQEDDYVLIRDLLWDLGQSYFQIEWCRNFESGLTALITGAFDVCLLDYQLGARTGIDLLDELPQHQENTTAILMLAGKESPAIDKRAMQSGVMGYLIKNELNSALIERSIRYALSHRLNQLALQDYALELERKNQELAIARDDAFAAIRLKAEFLSNMSHETRTPLNGILGLLHLLQETTLAPDQKEALQSIKDCTETLLSMINNILDFSRIEEGHLDIQRIDFDIRATIAEIIAQQTSHAHRKNLDLVTVIHANVPNIVQGDPGRLRQIINTLLGNAIKFTETGEIKVHVTVESEKGSEIVIKFGLTDSGIGITEEQQQRLFHPFTQGDGSSTRKYQGAGLGLSIAKHLTELMEGTIGVDSSIGQGSQFWVTIPFTQASQDTKEASHFPFDPRGLRAVLISANPTNQSFFNLLCRNWDISLISCPTAEQGLKALREVSIQGMTIDVVIIDQSIPDMDEFTLAEHINPHDRLNHLPVILITEGARGEAKRAQEVGIAAYLTTPIQAGQFLECLRHLSPSSTKDQTGIPQTLITKHSLRDAQAMDKTRILLVDDNAINQKVIIRVLEKLGHRVDVVPSAQEGITAIHTHSYHLVLCDEWFIECDQSLWNLLQQELVRYAIPMVLITNAPAPLDDNPHPQQPIVAKLCKPVRRTDLAEVITSQVPKDRVATMGHRRLARTSEVITS